MATRRADVVDPSVVQILHVCNRCVRRAFLCGVDSVSEKDYSHRRQWLQDRLQFLVGLFAIDIATFAIMSNHFHLVLRTRHDIVATWSDREVATRNMKLQGKVWFRKDGTPRKSAEAEIERICSNPEELERIRKKLSDVSSFMAYFDEHIAKLSNAEDNVKGAFWEGTFQAEVIEDETSLLACMAYVDLNPIRAMMAETLEESDFTGAFERIGALRSALATESLEQCDEPDSENQGESEMGSVPESDAQKADMQQAADMPTVPGVAAHQAGSPVNTTLDFERTNPRLGWLSPIELDPRGDLVDASRRGWRSSSKGFLPISLMKYLEVVEWAGRMTRPDKRGATPADTPPVFERLGVDPQGFLSAMMKFESLTSYFIATERQGVPENSFAST